jgi:hypothetical protein
VDDRQVISERKIDASFAKNMNQNVVCSELNSQIGNHDHKEMTPE